MWLPSRGSPSSPVWVLVDRPFSTDKEKGYLFSSGAGYVFDKMMQEAGINDYYITCFRPDTENLKGYKNVIGELNQYKPPVIIPLEHCGQHLIPAMELTVRKMPIHSENESNIEKYAGSILTSPHLNYSHYIIPTLGVLRVIAQWKLRDIVISCDLQKAAAELEYWKTHGQLQPLPDRVAKINFEAFDELLAILDSFFAFPILSNDIETVYPKPPTKTQPSAFYGKQPGYPVVIGLAPTVDFGISFELFRDSTAETRELWKKLSKLLWEVPSVGQNFFNFDANFYEMLGMRLPLEKCRDTMILHHQLWPELRHKLQFLARQYTREPYYKDEGAGWGLKNMDAMRRYNCKDVMCTLEIYQRELEELKDRGLE